MSPAKGQNVMRIEIIVSAACVPEHPGVIAGWRGYNPAGCDNFDMFIIIYRIIIIDYFFHVKNLYGYEY